MCGPVHPLPQRMVWHSDLFHQREELVSPRRDTLRWLSASVLLLWQIPRPKAPCGWKVFFYLSGHDPLWRTVRTGTLSSMNMKSPISLLFYTALPSTKGLPTKEESRNHRETLLAHWLTQDRVQLVSLYIPEFLVQGIVSPTVDWGLLHQYIKTIPPLPPRRPIRPRQFCILSWGSLSGGSRLCQVHG